MTKKIIELAKDLALKAGALQKKSVGKVRKVTYKGAIDLVTDVDQKCEKLIVDGIRKAFPSHSILAEEGSAADVGDGQYRWVIDPIDGTTNFAHGFPVYCVSIGVEHQGELIAGVIYDPNQEEMFVAQKGKGAFLNGKRIHVSQTKTLLRSLMATGFAYDIRQSKNSNIRNFSRMLKAAQAVRRPGSAAIDLAYVACGRFDGFWERNLKPWDMAAGILMVREAGGLVSTLDGQSFVGYPKFILASNGLIHKEMRSHLK